MTHIHTLNPGDYLDHSEDFVNVPVGTVINSSCVGQYEKQESGQWRSESGSEWDSGQMSLGAYTLVSIPAVQEDTHTPDVTLPDPSIVTAHVEQLIEEIYA